VNQATRHSLPAKGVAIGFIVQILLGNYWLILKFTGAEPPAWFSDAILAGAFWIILCGFGMLLSSVFQKRD
jgi:hypothetical protein